MLCQLIGDPLGLIDGNGKPDSLIGSIPGRNGRADRDRPAIEVDQGASRIPWVDGSIGLKKATTADASQRPVLGTDDSCTDCRFEPERATDRQHPVTDLKLVRIAQFHGGETPFATDVQRSHIAVDIADHCGGLHFGFVCQFYHHAFGASDHMIVGDDHAIFGNDDSAADAGQLLLVRFGLVGGGLVFREWVVGVGGRIAIGHHIDLSIGQDRHRGRSRFSCGVSKRSRQCSGAGQHFHIGDFSV